MVGTYDQRRLIPPRADYTTTDSEFKVFRAVPANDFARISLSASGKRMLVISQRWRVILGHGYIFRNGRL